MGCAHLVHLPLILFAPEIQKFLAKTRVKFLENSENFFGGHFLLHGKFRKQTKHGILFYLTNKNRKQNEGTEGSSY